MHQRTYEDIHTHRLEKQTQLVGRPLSLPLPLLQQTFHPIDRKSFGNRASALPIKGATTSDGKESCAHELDRASVGIVILAGSQTRRATPISLSSHCVCVWLGSTFF